MDENPNEWAIAYHEIGRNSPDVENITNTIFTKKFFKVGPNQALENYDDMNHPGKKKVKEFIVLQTSNILKAMLDYQILL